MVVLLGLLDVIVNIFSKKDLGRVLVNVCSCQWYCEHHTLLTIDGDPDVLGFGALAPGIARQGLDGTGKLVRLGSCTHVINVTLQVLS